jgi:DNA-directed RNA polymerase specialized sigma24 family protein
VIDAEGLVTPAVRTPEAAESHLAEVYVREHGRLAALGTLLTGDAAVGEDLAHDVFLHALRRCRQEPGYLRDPAWPWLRLALVRRAMRRGERIAGELRRLALLHGSTPPAPWSPDTVDCLRALAGLPPRMRACAVLFYWQDMATAEVARELGLSERTVENQLRRARARLAELLRVAVPGEEN